MHLTATGHLFGWTEQLTGRGFGMVRAEWIPLFPTPHSPPCVPHAHLKSENGGLQDRYSIPPSIFPQHISCTYGPKSAHPKRDVCLTYADTTLSIAQAGPIQNDQIFPCRDGAQGLEAPPPTVLVEPAIVLIWKTALGRSVHSAWTVAVMPRLARAPRMRPQG
jgi:hypothetical protein